MNTFDSKQYIERENNDKSDTLMRYAKNHMQNGKDFEANGEYLEAWTEYQSAHIYFTTAASHAKRSKNDEIYQEAIEGKKEADVSFKNAKETFVKQLKERSTKKVVENDLTK